jgi:hypothetical protein
VPCFSAIETWSFGASGSVVLLYWGICYPVVLGLRGVRVRIVALILLMVVRCSSAGEVHRYWNVVIRWTGSVGRVVHGSLLLGSLLVLGASSPGARSELSLVLTVIESSWVQQSSLGSDEFDHLSPLRDVDGSGLVFVVVLGKWYLDDFIKDARGESIEEEPDGFLVANRVSGLAY